MYHTTRVITARVVLLWSPYSRLRTGRTRKVTGNACAGLYFTEEVRAVHAVAITRVELDGHRKRIPGARDTTVRGTWGECSYPGQETAHLSTCVATKTGVGPV